MMSQFAQRTALAFGLATAAIAFAPTAEAQIQVTGGVIDGQAAFFNPDAATGAISLFDIAITNMQLVSPNGVLTNPIFVPTAAGGFVDKDDSDSVTAGDTGLILGELSGIGFDEGGSIIPFSRVDTAVAYNVSRFQQIGADLPGSLVTSGVIPIPQLFFADPVPTVIGSNPNLEATPGNLQIGEFNSNVTAGVIDLPSNLQLASTGGGSSAFLRLNSRFAGTSVSYRGATDDSREVDDDGNDAEDRDFFFNLGGARLTFNVNVTLNGSTRFTTSSSTSLEAAKALIEAFLDDVDIDSLSHNAVVNVFSGDDDGDDDDDDDGGESRYQIIKSPTYRVRIRETRGGNIRVTIRVHNRRGNRVLIALRGDSLIGAFQQVGSSSRMFPGLAGLRQLSDEEAAELLEELQAEEVADDDVADDDGDDTDDDVADDDGDDTDDDVADDDGDDTDDDVADDDGDDTDDDVADDDGDDTDDDVADDDGDDAEDPAIGPVFEGLDSLSDEEVDAINDQINPADPGAETPTEEAPAETTPAEETPGVAPEAPAEEPAPEAPAEEPAPEAPAEGI